MSADVPPPAEISEDAIAAALPALLARSYARYSKFTVAAAVIDETGAVHYGVNVENAAYPQGTCAEQTAIGAMITAAGARRIDKVLIAAGSDAVVQPCGGCRHNIARKYSTSCRLAARAAPCAMSWPTFSPW